MTRTPVRVKSGDSCEDVFRMFQENCIRHAPVVDGGQLVGVVSERDLMRALPWLIADVDARTEAKPSDTTVKSVMAARPVTCGLNDPLDEVALEMESNKIGCMPVVDRGQLVGLLTVMDLLRGFSDHFGRSAGRAVTLVWTHGKRLEKPNVAALCVAAELRLSTMFESHAESGAQVILLRVHGSDDALSNFLRACDKASLGVLAARRDAA